MEKKTTFVLMLSLVAAAGITVSDVYAQTNTERLESIDDRTQEISDTIGNSSDETGLFGALANVASDIADALTAIAGVQTSVDSVDAKIDSMMSNFDSIATISSNINTMRGTLNSVSSTVSSIDSSISLIDSTITANSDAVNSMRSDVSSLTTSTMMLTDAVSDNAASLQDIQNDLALLNKRIMGVEDTISQQQLGATGDVAVSVAASNARLDALDTVLKQIQDNLITLRADVSVLSSQITNPDDPTTIIDATTSALVTAYDYKTYDKNGTTINGNTFHELELRFSCNQDAFIDQVRFIAASHEDALDYVRGNNLEKFDIEESTPNNFVRVDGIDLFNNKVLVNQSTDQYVKIERAHNYNNKPLLAGSTLPFTSQIHEGLFVLRENGELGPLIQSGSKQPYVSVASNTTMIADSERNTRDNDKLERDLYYIEVDWITYYTGTSCTVGVGTSGSLPNADAAGTLQYSVNVTNDGKVINEYSNVMDCGGNPVEITGVSTAIAGSWEDGLDKFATMNMEVLDNRNDDIPDVIFQLMQNDEATIKDGEYPIYANADLQISGSFPIVDNLLVEIEYLSVPNAGCTIVDSQ